jgi:hypothetical protein
MNRIKKYFLRLRLRYGKTNNNVVRKTLNYEQAQHIGFLFFTTNRNMSTSINRFMKSLIEENKEIDALAYLTSNSENPYGFKYDICTEEQINWLGEVTNPKVKEFIKKDFDYLYCVAIEKCEIIDYVLKYSHAKCRIGCFDGTNAENFELMLVLQAGENVDKLIEQMIQYTKKALVSN